MTGRKLLELEGLRGIAAAVVVATHVLGAFDSSVPRPPDVRGLGVWRNGEFAVRVFFVLSGLVLTLKFFQTGQTAHLASGAVRRYPRLLLPIAASVALGYGLQAAGLIAGVEAADLKPEPYRGDIWLRDYYQTPPSAARAVREAAYDAYFAYKPLQTYNNVLWTMSAEFSGSLFVFGVAAAFGNRRRAALYAAVAAVLALGWHTHLFNFLCGLVLADSIALGRPRPGWWAVLLLPAGLVAGDAQSGLLRHLGAPLAVAGAVFSPAWAAALRTRVPVFLGRVSFCLYLFHVPVLYSLGCHTYIRAVNAGYTTGGGGVGGRAGHGGRVARVPGDGDRGRRVGPARPVG